MGISEILMGINKTYNLDSLTQLTEGTFPIIYPYTVKEYKSYKQLEDILTSKGLSCNNVYFNLEMHNNCWYIDGDVILYLQHLLPMQVECLSQDMVTGLQCTYNKLKQDNDWESFICMQPAEFKVDIFKRCTSGIPKDKLIGVIRDLYCNTNQIMTAIPKNDIVNLLSNLNYRYTTHYNDKLDRNGMLLVYRGETSKSTPIKEALSFSRDMNIAKHFAIFTQDVAPKIYIAKVDINNILLDIDYEEKEVLVKYEDLIDLETIELYTLYDYVGVAQDIYNTVKPLLSILKDSKGIHGYNHSKRMLQYLCTMYANGLQDDLSEQEFNMLVIACVLHDMGRTHDGRCYKHGENSIKFINKVIKLAEQHNIIINGKNDYLIDILKAVVKYHCISDEEAIIHTTEDIVGEYKERAIYLLSLFKDLDNLDRVRTHDFDINYLRLTESIRCVGLAKTLFSKN